MSSSVNLNVWDTKVKYPTYLTSISGIFKRKFVINFKGYEIKRYEILIGKSLIIFCDAHIST